MHAEKWRQAAPRPQRQQAIKSAFRGDSNLQPAGQLGYSRRLKQSTDCQLHSQFGTYLAGQTGGNEGMSTQSKKVVVDAHILQPKHLLKYFAQDFLVRG